MNRNKRRRGAGTTRSVVSGRQVLIAQAALAGGLALALVMKELPGVVRELRIYRMTGGPRANRRYP
ncbi:hypothetical protein NX794_27175 [Streptomyces sp. LP11]|uniref:Uncharacterized protein n=1 Tax=Streptomyces pyxinicus TaxID=2970331 RepID=A0ABT2B8M4_9ACTN|nr:hypothetical protein [Streptomyces sp. LP11]MCS0604869.1 hypothetical protein [Streptomyces sp. LP11]